MEFARLAEPRLSQKRSENQTELDALVTLGLNAPYDHVVVGSRRV